MASILKIDVLQPRYANTGILLDSLLRGASGTIINEKGEILLPPSLESANTFSANTLVSNTITANSYSGITLDMITGITATATANQVLTADGSGNFFFQNNASEVISSITDLSISDGTAGQVLTTHGNGSFFFAAASDPIAVKKTNSSNAILSTVTNVNDFRFDSDSGFDVVDLGSGAVKIQMNSTFKTLKVSGQSDLVATGLDTLEIVGGVGITITTNPTGTPHKTLTFNGVSLLTDLGITDGTANQVLTTDGSGNLSWTASIDLANDANNRVVTGDGSGGLNGEANLTFDGSTLTVTGEVSMTTLDIGGTNVTSTAAELNILDGVTATASEINIIDGDTSASSVTIVDADQIILNDGGTMKQVAVSALNTYTSSSVPADNISTGSSAVNITTSSGNITIDAAANDTDIIFKGTDGGADTTFLTIDGSAAGAATFNDKIIATELDISGDVDVDGTLETDALSIASTTVTATGTELNLLDGGTSVGSSITLADSDGIVVNDSGTMKTMPASDIKTFVGAGAGAFSIANLDIDGGTDIGADLVDADLFIVDDGAGGTNRKVAASRIKTYIGGGTQWQAVKTGNYTASAGQGVFANTTSGSFTVTLPAGTLGDEVTIVDYAGTFDSNALTVAANGSEKIFASTDDLTVSTERAAFTLVYTDSTQGWLFKND